MRRRVTAGVGALALTVTGLAVLSTPAFAAPGPGQAGAPTDGSLIIHKRTGTTGDPGTGNVMNPAPGTGALAGVEFTVARIGLWTNGSCEAIDLTTPAGWTAAAGAAGPTSPAPVSPASEGAFCVVSAQTATTTAPDGIATVNNLALGLYYVTETKAPAGVVQPANPFYVTLPYSGTSEGAADWLYTVHVYPKNAVAKTPTKTIGANQTDLVIGANVTWTISQEIPTLSTNDTFTEASITDTLDPRLTYVSSTVTVGSTTLYTPADYSPSNVNGVLTWTLTPAGRGALKANPGVTLSVDVVTEVTSVGSGGTAGVIKNQGSVSFNSKPQETPEVETRWGALKVTKHDSVQTGQALADAQFEVHNNAANGQCAATKPATGGLATGVSGDDGVVDWTRVDQPTTTVEELGLWVSNEAGTTTRTYCLYETQAPAGYSIGTPNPRPVTISTGATNALTTVPVANVKNPGPNLPLTGAQGTALFTMAGLALVAVAGGGALVRARRNR